MGKDTIDKVLTVEEAAKRKDVCIGTIVKAIRMKKLKATFFHGKWHIRKSNLELCDPKDKPLDK